MIDVGAIARRFNELNAAENAKAAAQREAALLEGARLASLIGASDPAVRAVIGFGSAYEPGRSFRLDSDIDLAVDGGDPLGLSRLVESSSFHVDLIDLSGARDEFSRFVRERGTVLFSRGGE